ncbi:MAG: hypothetical protein JWO93_2403 [Micrococcaceae bacterium]|nr:hypothetical protein [Micrococcaceae bacterium]
MRHTVAPARLWRPALRWPRTTIAGWALALAVGATVFVVTPPSYSLNATYMFLPHSGSGQDSGSEQGSGSELASGVAKLADVLRVSLPEDPTIQQFTSAHPGTTFSVNPASEAPAPYLTVTVAGADIAERADAIVQMTDEAGARLNAAIKAIIADVGLQLNVPQANPGPADDPSSTSIEVSWETKAVEPNLSVPIRNGSLAALAGFGLLFLLLAALEYRRAREQTKSKTAPSMVGTRGSSDRLKRPQVLIAGSQTGRVKKAGKGAVDESITVPAAEWSAAP